MSKWIITVLMPGVLSCRSATLTVKPNAVTREVDRHRFLGTNVGLWHEARQLFDTDVQYWLRELNPSFIRIPGGSWSDEYIWNGNGVWDGNTFDLTKFKEGQWNIDYSAYAPGFHLLAPDQPDEWHGNVDVYALHEFARDKGSHSIVTVNVGSGTPEMAAEWVRWANLKMGYGVKYWEIGNELEGRWEMGSTLPDGSRMTGETYAKKFIAYAKAMKAVDPSIKVGGPAAANTRAVFLDDLLRIAGDQLDFISIHTYPVDQAGAERAFFEKAFSLDAPMARYRRLIEKYQPARKNQIEIAVTEWNSKVVEDRDSADLLNGLWSALFVGDMFREGVSFATQWDLLTSTPEGGHGLFHFDGHCVPKSQYWGLYLWSKYMGDTLVRSSLDDAAGAYAFATRDARRLFVMIVNTSRNEARDIRLDVPGTAFAPSGRMATLSHREYFWNPYAHKPEWSRKPVGQAFAIGQHPVLQVPPFSARVFELPLKGHAPRLSSTTANAAVKPLKMLLPDSSPVDLPAEGWVLLQNDPADPKAGRPLGSASLSIEGPATLDVDRVDLSEAAGRFHVKPTGAGTVTVRAKAGDCAVEQSLRIEPVDHRTQVAWHFDGDPSHWGMQSTFRLAVDDTVRPNRQVAAVVLDGARPDEGHDALAVFSPIPDTVQKARIAGVVLDLGVSNDFKCADPDIGVRVVLQSEGNHWIELGTVRLGDFRGKWKSLELPLPESKDYALMARAYALYVQLYENGSRKKPASGRVYLDNVGFMLR